jgi:predicted nucleic acid-binding protein
MILYLDASALVKRYVAEPGSTAVNEAIIGAEVVGTAIISRAEVAAALAKSARMKVLSSADAAASLHAFRQEWLDLVRVQVTELVVSRADMLAWDHQLRGYDAVQLAAASIWQEAMDAPVTVATFDQHLWSAAEQIGLIPYPTDLGGLQGCSVLGMIAH